MNFDQPIDMAYEISELEADVEALLVMDALQQEKIAKQAEYIELLENQVISMMAEDPIPFLPVDPEEQRRLDAKASDGTQCMIYRGH
jgi:hypothetical protein